MADTALDTNNVPDNDDIISNLKLDIPKRDNLSSSLRDEKQRINEVDSSKNSDIITNVNGAVLLEFLSPEINNNENAKRKHKYILIFLVAVFLYFQFNTVYKMSTLVMNYAVSQMADIEILKLLIGFVSAYITSVVVELIAILNYVVKRVFDTSIKELIELFREDDRSNQIKDQENWFAVQRNNKHTENMNY